MVKFSHNASIIHGVQMVVTCLQHESYVSVHFVSSDV